MVPKVLNGPLVLCVFGFLPQLTCHLHSDCFSYGQLAQRLAGNQYGFGCETPPLTLVSCNITFLTPRTAKLPKPPADGSTDELNALPQTLVRIPTEHAPALQAQAEQAEGDLDEP